MTDSYQWLLYDAFAEETFDDMNRIGGDLFVTIVQTFFFWVDTVRCWSLFSSRVERERSLLDLRVLHQSQKNERI